MFELLNTDSGNVIGTYETKGAALAAARRLIAADKRVSSIQSLALGYEDGRGRSKLIAAGLDLLSLVSGPKIVSRPVTAFASQSGPTEKATAWPQSFSTMQTDARSGVFVDRATATRSARTACKSSSKVFIHRDSTGRFTSHQVDVGHPMTAERRKGSKDEPKRGHEAKGKKKK
jgi:hypothetical protein